MVHRPNKSMFSKTALLVSTAAGGGMRTAINDMAQILGFWGVSKIYTFGCAVSATKWEDVTEKRKFKIEQRVKSISRKIVSTLNNVTPGIKTKAMFSLFRMMQKKFGIPYDKNYWQELGWLDDKRPWKD